MSKTSARTEPTIHDVLDWALEHNHGGIVAGGALKNERAASWGGGQGELKG